MPLKSGAKTPQEAVWRDEMARTGDPLYAAAKAGYAHPQPAASKNLAKPELMADVQRETSRLLARGALSAAARLVGIVESKTSKDSDAVAAAKVILAQVRGAEEERKAPHEMSGDELQRAIDRLRREASERAKVIEGVAVVDAQQDATTNTLFD